MNVEPEENTAGESKRILPESLKKVVASGLSALFMTEEGVRQVLSDMRLPKEALAFLSQQTDKTRRELFRAVSGEIKNFLGSMDLPGVLRKTLSGMTVEIRTQVRFVDDKTVKKTTRSKVKTNREKT